MDAFEREYTAPLLDEDPMPAAGAGLAGPFPIGVAAATPFSLHGCVLTPISAWMTAGSISTAGSCPGSARQRRLQGSGASRRMASSCRG